ncbi:hypothetical protein G3M48_005403 [Beauveria asiatica]|uniref:Uncharacterized protein n=1 Tax=Beauveria asiatica TaxID=1069075 RepID=A0AAW0RRH6_9HYPO
MKLTSILIAALGGVAVAPPAHERCLVRGILKVIGDYSFDVATYVARGFPFAAWTNVCAGCLPQKAADAVLPRLAHFVAVAEAVRQNWSQLLISAPGSRGCDPRQIDGIGGGTSTASKVALVSPSTRPRIDVDFTGGVIVETVEIDQDGQFREDGEYNIPGVSTSGSEIKVAFVDPAGSMTDKLFPTGQRQLVLAVQARKYDDFKAKVTLIDAANPFVLIDATSTSPLLQTCSPHNRTDAKPS